MKYNLSKPIKKEAAATYFNKLVKLGKNIELREIKKKRTFDQNSLYWLWLTVLQVETGMDKDELHLLYRAKFLQKPETYITSVIYPVLWDKIYSRIIAFDYFKGLEDVINIISKSTTVLDTGEYTHYLNSIKDHAQENMNVTLITLDDKMFDDFYNEYISYQK